MPTIKEMKDAGFLWQIRKYEVKELTSGLLPDLDNDIQTNVPATIPSDSSPTIGWNCIVDFYSENADAKAKFILQKKTRHPETGVDSFVTTAVDFVDSIPVNVRGESFDRRAVVQQAIDSLVDLNRITKEYNEKIKPLKDARDAKTALIARVLAKVPAPKP